MKRRILCLFLTICMLFGTLSILTACGGDGDPCIQCIDLDNNGKCDVCKNVIEKDDDGDTDGDKPATANFVIKADKTEVSRSETVTLSAFLKSGETEENITSDVEFSIVSGTESATILGNVLTIKSTASHGDVIKVKAREGATDSNEISITVKVPATAITISTNGSANILAGQSVAINSAVTPTGANNSVSYVITEGKDYASFQSNVLMINNDAPTGATVKVKAVIGELESNVLTFTVGYPLTGIAISSTATNVISGQSALINVTINPENSTNANYVWTFVEGGDYASFVGNALAVNANAPTGAVIKVKAVAGSIESNVLTFIVGYPLEEIKISSPVTNIISGQSTNIKVTVKPENSTNAKYTWTFISGGDYAYFDENALVIKANAPTGTVIKVKAVAGSIESNELSFIVGYPLESIAIDSPLTNVMNGQSTPIGVTINPTNATNASITWTFVEGGDYASVVGNNLTVKANAPTGAVIKVKAVAGSIESNVLSFIVGYPLESLTITSGATNIKNGNSAQIVVSLNPTNATNGDYAWEFVEGKDYATIVGNIITVNDEAPTGAKITVKAVAGSVESNELSFIVGYPLKSLTASLIGSTNIKNGYSAQLVVSLNPSNATNGDYVWEFVEGEEFATIVGNFITIGEDAPIGSTIRIQAISGDIKSNVLTIMVGTPIETITITSSAPAILDRGESYPISSSVTPAGAAQNAINWVVAEGAPYVTIESGRIFVASNTPAGTKVTIYAESGSIKSNELTFTVGIVLEKIDIALNGSANIDPNSNRVISSTLTPSNASDTEITWVITEGKDYATVSGGMITVNSDAPIGAKVTFYAEIGSVKSESITITVGTPVESLDIELNGSANINPGANGVITVTGAENATVSWVITEGGNFATVKNGVITVNSDAPIGAKITFHAEVVYTAIPTVKSDSITITVGTPVESLDIELNGSANIDPNGTGVITVTGAGNATISWIIDSGAAYATIKNGVITINSDAPIGAKVTFHAEVVYTAIPTVKSDSITITVGTPIESIEIGALGSTNVIKGNTVGLDVDITPSKATGTYSWVITEGSEYASIKGTTLIVNANAATGATIKVKAVSVSASGVVESNEISFKVVATQEEINANKYLLDLNTNSIRIDKKGTDAPILIAEIVNGNYDSVTDKEISFTVIEGAEFLALVENGYTCSFQAIGHGKAIVEVKIEGIDSSVSELVTVDVIVPPDAVVLPEVFIERPLYEYNFSKIDRFNGDKEASLPFVPTVKGAELACTDLVYNFVGANGKTGSDVAVYENGAITFKTTGKVIVTVSSASGSKVEATTTYTFNINEGYNVGTYEELNFAVRYLESSSSRPINIVALDKPVGNYSYTYGYDLVPEFALKAQADQTLHDILGDPGQGNACFCEYNGVSYPMPIRIQAVNKGLILNGNQHSIDVSQVRVFSQSELNAYNEKNGTTAGPNWSSVFSIEPWDTTGPGGNLSIENKVYEVSFSDLTVKGNAPIDYDPKNYGGKDEGPIGVFTVGINVGQYQYDVQYHTTAKNLTASGFAYGITINNVIDGKFDNLYAYNCYSTGIKVRSSIVEISNIKLGKCGATGIELDPTHSNKAGLDQNQISKVTFSGTIDASANLNNGQTTYFTNYDLGGATVPQIITLNASQYHNNQVSHIRNANGEFIFVSLMFINVGTMEANYSIVDYPAYQAGGIIDISALPTSGVDTEHQYISMSVTVPTAMGNLSAGTAYFYNMNYVAK